MKAVRIHETGGPEVLGVEEVDTPAPGPGQVLIRAGVAGVNFTDVMARQGAYIAAAAAPQLPAILGTEVAGVIAATGPGVPGDLAGRRVVAFVRGGYAEYAIAPTELVTELPPGIDLAEATAYLVQGVTAWQLLTDCGHIAPGESVLVHSAAGGVGLSALQLARKLESRPVRDLSRPHAEDDLAAAVRLAAEAGEWAVVTTLSRQLEALRREREGGGLRVIEGGSGAAGSGER